MSRLRNFAFFVSILMFLGFVFLFFLIPQVLAADLEVTFESDPFFSQVADGYWYPGRSETRWVSVKNNSDEDKTVIVETNSETTTYSKDLADVLKLTVAIGGVDVYGGTLGTKYLADFYNESELPLSVLSPGQTVTYNFTVSLDKSVGNDWQDKDTGFDLKIGFYGVASIPTSTPTPGGAGTVAGAVTAPVCTATVSTSAPVLSITGVGGVITPSGALGETLATETGEVAGAAITPRDWRIWILIGLGIIGGNIIIYFRFFKRR